MKKHKFKMSSIFLDNEMLHKCDGVSYDNESKRAEELLDIISGKLQSVISKKRRRDVVSRLEKKYFTAKTLKEYISSLNEVYKKPFGYIEITQEEYDVWYKYWLEYYVDDYSLFGDIRLQFGDMHHNPNEPKPEWLPNKKTKSWEYLEADKLLKRMKKVFGEPELLNEHRAGAKISFAKTLVDTGVAQKLIKGNDTEH